MFFWKWIILGNKDRDWVIKFIWFYKKIKFDKGCKNIEIKLRLFNSIELLFKFWKLVKFVIKIISNICLMVCVKC